MENSDMRQTGSLDRTTSAGSSMRQQSQKKSGSSTYQQDEDIISINASEAGDIGDRALSSNRRSESNSLCFSIDGASESGIGAPMPENMLLQSPLPGEIISPIANEGKKIELSKLVEYTACLIHLAFFGILGVLTRYILQKLFGPGVAGVTSDHTVLYLDLPSNMVGSFLMGWFGVVFKKDIAHVSDFLAIGLSTGYLGSLTTFSGWNQKMLDLSVNGHWVLSMLGFLIGLSLVGLSIIIGIWTAKGFRFLIKKINAGSVKNRPMINSFKSHFIVIIVLTLLIAFLWSLSGTLLAKEFSSHGNGPQLWLGCLVGPFGVWIRWYLARLNGRGLGKKGILKWFPFGTLSANVSAACMMAALSTCKKAANSRNVDTLVVGIQLGFLGCLSTVSTFAAELYAMIEGKSRWQACAYALITIGISFGLGTLIFSVPVWTRGYE